MKKTLSILCTIAILLVTVLVPSSMIAYADAVPTSVIKEYGYDTAYPDGALHRIQETFSTPKDCSGSDGYILFSRTDVTTTAQEITIYTTNKTSSSYFIPYNTPGNDIQIPLETLGLTDADLSSVTGFQVDLYYNGSSAMMWGYGITAPKAPVATSVIREYAVDETAYPYGELHRIQQTFDVPKDCSGSEGYISFRRTDASTTAQEITIYTANKTSNSYFIPYNTPGNVIQIPLENLGLTDADLSNVTGFQVDLYYNGDNYMMWGYGITVPKAAIPTDTIAASKASGTIYREGNWMGDYANTVVEETFVAPLDCSGSDGYITVVENRVENIYMWLTIYTENKTSTQYSTGNYRSASASTITRISLTSLGLTDEDLERVTGYRLETNNGGGSDITDHVFSIKAYKQAVETRTIKEYAVDATAYPWGTVNSIQQTFDVPKDCSGSEGYISFRRTDASTTAQEITIYTANKTSNSYFIPYNTPGNVIQIPLTTLGLTDADLSSVIGFQVDLYYNGGDYMMWGYGITVPKAAVVTDTIESGATVTAPAWGSAAGEKLVNFDTPLNLSGSNGYIVVKGNRTSNVAVSLLIYTEAKTSSLVDVRTYGANSYGDSIPISSFGLTDSDLQRVTGYYLVVYTNEGSNLDYTFSIHAYKPATVTGVTIAENAALNGGNWCYGNYGNNPYTISETFEAARDLSGSNGYLTIFESQDVVNTYYELTIYTDAGNGTYSTNGYRAAGAAKAYKVPLSSFGLTDADLKRVTGYSITVWHCDNTGYLYTISIHAYKPAVASDVLEAGASVASGNWGQNVGTKSVTFDGLRDFSTNIGYVELDYSSTAAYVANWNMGMYFKLTVYTTTKTASYEPGWIAYETAGKKQYCQIYFTDLGLSNAELAEVMGYKLEITQNSNPSTVSFSLRVPSAAPAFNSDFNLDLPTTYDNGYLYIMPGTTVSDIESYYPYAQVTNGSAEVTTGRIATGMTVSIVYNAQTVDTACAVVYDDVNKDGAFADSDLTCLTQAILDIVELDSAQTNAIAHHGYGSTPNIRNLVRMKRIYMGDVIVGQVSTGTWSANKFYLSSGVVPTTASGLENYADLGYNMAEVSYSRGNINTVLSNLETLGVDAVVSDTRRFTLNYNALSYSENAIRKTVADYAKYNNVIGYQVFDEITPGTSNKNYTDAQSVNYYLNKYNPNSLKFMNLLPSYGDTYNWANNNYASYLTDYISALNPQVLSFDYYPYLMGTAGNTSNWWRDLGLFRQQSLANNIPLWYYYQGIGIADGRSNPTNAEVMYQMYVGLAYGAKQLSEWTAVGDGLDNEGAKTSAFDTVKARNAEVMTVGSFLFDKSSTAIYHTGLNSSYFSNFYLDNISNSTLLNSAPNNLILSVFEDETSAKYLLVVNKSTTTNATGTIQLDAAKSISKLNKSTGAVSNLGSANSISLNIAAGSAEVYVLS